MSLRPKIVKANWVIRLGGAKGSQEDKEIILLLKKGDRVEMGQVLAKIRERKQVAEELGRQLGQKYLERIRKTVEKQKGRQVEKGEQLFSWGAIFKKRIYAPVTGELMAMDEFNHLLFRDKEVDEREILSPVAATATTVDRQKISLEFKAMEVMGESPSNGGKIWGEGNFDWLLNTGALTAEMREKIVFGRKIDDLFLIKADVLGVAGVVCLEYSQEVEFESRILVLKVKEEEILPVWEKFAGESRRMLLNAKMGRLLVVIQ